MYSKTKWKHDKKRIKFVFAAIFVCIKTFELYISNKRENFCLAPHVYDYCKLFFFNLKNRNKLGVAKLAILDEIYRLPC